MNCFNLLDKTKGDGLVIPKSENSDILYHWHSNGQIEDIVERFNGKAHGRCLMWTRKGSFIGVSYWNEGIFVTLEEYKQLVKYD